MLVLDVELEGTRSTERLSIEKDIESITLETTRHAKPVECDRVMWNWIESHFDSENAGLDGQ